MKKAVGIILRGLVAAGILFYLFKYKIHPQDFWNTIRHVDWRWFLAGVLLYGVTMWCGIFRWQILLRAQQITLPLRWVTAITFIGQFFNAFLLGGTGGDVVRAYFISQQARGKKVEGVVSVLTDRIIGLLALFALTFTMMTIHIGWLWKHPNIRWSAVVVMILIGAAFCLIPLSLHPGLSLLGRRGRWLTKWIPFREQISRGISSYQSYAGHRRALLYGFLLSLALHLSNLTGSFLLGQSLGIWQVHWSKYFLIVPMINTIASLPITISGFGVREEMYRRVFGDMGVAAEQAIALGLLNYALQFIWSVAGGLVYLFWHHEPHLVLHARGTMVRQ